MNKSFNNTSEKISNYVKNIFHPEDPILKEIRERSQKEGLPLIQVGEMDALHLEVITRSIGAKKAVEIGTLGGYSGVSIARGLAKGGMLYTFEYSPHHAKVAEVSFRKAKVEHQVQIFVGAALDNLPKIEKWGPFDLVFMDADKINYTHYLLWAEKNLRVGGVVLADNAFGFGMIADEVITNQKDSVDVEALRRFNSSLANHPHFKSTILPTGEGLMMAVKIRSQS